ncbi:MAG: hypothetical protein MUC65_09990, partial [Pontiellaceae bacterium]|nr:hypothetical protein [Pontiellaceae bacterium]
MNRIERGILILAVLALPVNSLLAQITNIVQLDEACVFSFSAISDNRGYDTTQTARAQNWSKANHEFVLGVGDILEANSTAVTKFLNMLRDDPFWKNNYFPVFGNLCSIYTGSQTHWG